jgi:hypothetical protein
MRLILLLAALSFLGQFSVWAQPSPRIAVTLVKNSYNGSREEAELSRGPDALESGGLTGILSRSDVELKPTLNVRLTPEEDRQYGARNRMGLANGHLGRMVSETLKQGSFPI